MRLRLHGYWRSSSTWRVRAALQHKGLEYEVVPVHLLRGGGEQWSAEFRRKNPLGQVPVLEVVEAAGSRFLAQSMAILEWLEETQPGPALLPRDSWARQRARQLAELVNSGIQPLQNLALLQELGALVSEEQARAVARRAIERGLAAVEHMLDETAGRHAVGDAPSFADFFLVPQLYNARRFSVDLSPYPRASAVEQTCLALPAFQASHPDLQPDAVPP